MHPLVIALFLLLPVVVEGVPAAGPLNTVTVGCDGDGEYFV